MPYKSKEARLAAQREHYRRHREQVIAKVKERKHTKYAGVCKYCGAPTVGSSKNNIPEFCAKPECRSKHYKGHLFRHKGWKIKKELRKKQVMTFDELSHAYEEYKLWAPKERGSE